MHTKTVAELMAALESGETTSVELTQLFLERIKKYNGDINAYVTVCEDSALQAARQADEKRAAGETGALLGLPIAHKDIFCTEGVKTTCGSKMLDNFISPYESTVTQKFIDAGAVMLGKTNMDEFAMGSSNETSYFGKVQNPWDTNCVPGGSSGGSAAAVAAALAPAATGTDTGGSIRQPAALTGLTGLKPTYGRCSRFGMIAFASSLDQAGPMTRTAEDAALLLNVMSGLDEKDSTSIDIEVPDYTASLNDALDGLKIGVPSQYFGEGLNEDVAAAVREAISEFEKQGASIVEIDLPHTHLAVPAYYVIAPAECSANLSRFDGVRYGYRCEDPKDLMDMYVRSRSEGFGEEVKRRILVGSYALSAGFYDAYYSKAQKIRRLIKQDFDKAFEQVDVIMGPTATNPAFEFGSKTDNPVEMYLEDIYTIAVNLAGLPGMSVPCGLVNNKPVGLQIIGNYWQESKMLNVAHQYQQLTDWHTRVSPIAAEQ